MEALKFFFQIVRWRFSRPKYLNHLCHYNGRIYKIVAETFQTVALQKVDRQLKGRKYLRIMVSKKSVKVL